MQCALIKTMSSFKKGSVEWAVKDSPIIAFMN